MCGVCGKWQSGWMRQEGRGESWFLGLGHNGLLEVHWMGYTRLHEQRQWNSLLEGKGLVAQKRTLMDVGRCLVERVFTAVTHMMHATILHHVNWDDRRRTAVGYLLSFDGEVAGGMTRKGVKLG